MSTNIGVHLQESDEWVLRDCTESVDPFVSMEIHGITTLFIRHNTVEDLVETVMMAKTILDKAKEKEPS